MYTVNPNTDPSPIRDYLIMFTLAKMIYQNVTRKVIPNKNFFYYNRKNGFQILFMSLYVNISCLIILYTISLYKYSNFVLFVRYTKSIIDCVTANITWTMLTYLYNNAQHYL